MVDKKSKTEIEREYTIPLRVKWKNVPRYKRTNRAVKGIKEFLVRHMKIRDRDLNKIKIDRYLNEYVWFRGIKNPPSKIKVKAVKKDGIVNVELFELPKNLDFKKKKEERIEKRGEETKKKKSLLQKAQEKTTSSEEKSDEKTEEKKEKEEEKKSAVVEAGKQIAKQEARKTKHQTSKGTKQPKRPQRKSLAK